MDNILNPLKSHMERKLLKYSCGRQISCGCGAILDCGSAVLIQAPAGSVFKSRVICGACADRLPHHIIEKLKDLAETDSDNYTFLDGRAFTAADKAHKRAMAARRKLRIAQSGYWVGCKRFPSFGQALSEVRVNRDQPCTVYYLPRDIGDREISKKRYQSAQVADQHYLERMKETAGYFPETRLLAFTKNHGLNFKGLPLNLNVVFSMWNNWGNTRKSMPRAWMLDPKDPDPRIPADAIECPGNCETCGMCWSLGKGQSVVFYKH